MDPNERARIRGELARLNAERWWYRDELDRMRGELPRVNLQAQVVVAGVLAVAAGVAALSPGWSLWLVLAGLSAGVALVSAGWSLWPVLRGFGVVAYPLAEVTDEVEREQAMLSARIADVSRVERIVRRKFRRVQGAYLAALTALAFLVVALA